MPKIQLKCEECGTTYERWPSQAEGSRFCSRPCLARWMDRDVRSKHKAPWLRTLNRSRKHQRKAARASARRRKTKRVYRKTRGQHTHRRVAERIVGRKLLSTELVHHIDENKENNEEANLLIGISRSVHRKIHAWLTRNYEDKRNLVLRSRKGMEPGLKYKFKTKPYIHQVKALKKMIFNKGGGLFMEMGTGKSKVAIDFACAMHLKQGIDRVVIVCPKSVTSVWRIEIRKHAPEYIRKKIKWVIINYDKLPDRTVVKEDGTESHYEGKKHVLQQFLNSGKKSLLIADEGHLLKTPSAARSKAVYQMRKEADYYLHLTGTPLTKNPIDLYQQFKIMDETVFGTNKSHFEKQYCVFGGYGNYQLLRYINLEDLKKRAAPHVFQVKKDACLDLPSRQDVVIPVKLTGENQELYREMAMDGMCTLADGTEIDTEIMLTRRLRCQQLSSGFIPDAEKTIHRVGNDKSKKLDYLLQDMASQERKKVVIFCRFIEDLRECARIAKKNGFNILLFHGGTSEQDREKRLIEFHESKAPTVFITQIAAGSLGISLTAASEAIFFSLTDNYAQTAQAKDRVHRIGQHHPVTYYWLVAPGIDEAIMLAHKAKKDVADLLLTNPKLLMKAGYVK